MPSGTLAPKRVLQCCALPGQCCYGACALPGGAILGEDDVERPHVVVQAGVLHRNERRVRARLVVVPMPHACVSRPALWGEEQP